MSGPDICPTCLASLSSGAQEGLCSKCLWTSLFGEVDTEEEAGNPHSTALHSSEQPGRPLGRFGDFELLEVIARGGMGVVYRARKTDLNRTLALKVILVAGLPGEAEMIRFRAEAEAVANLDHPNIIPIYEVGEHEGVPYFTMKFAAGGSLARRRTFPVSSGSHRHPAGSIRHDGESDSKHRVFDAGMSAQMMAKTARAVHYAHQRGMLHRDLKPSNILLDEKGEPLVADFGLAKQIGADAHLTLSGMVLGTPSYIAPEQALGIKNPTTAVDIYSLGAVFYELLTGRPPFQSDTPWETLRLVVGGEVPRPSSIHDQIERDLETICLKCLSKEPSQRYGSAELLAEDLERWMRNEPILARRTRIPERVQKWVKRHPALTAFLLLFLITPPVIIAILLFSNLKVRNANHRTMENLYAADMFLADRALQEGNLGLVRSTLSIHLPAPGQVGGEQDYRGFEWRLLWQRSKAEHLRILTGFPRPPTVVAISPDGRELAMGGQDYLWRWNLDDSAGVEILPPKEPRWLDPEGAKRLLSKVRMSPFSSKETANPDPSPSQLSQWVNPEHIDTVTGLSFSPDGRQIVASTQKEGRAVRVWNLTDGKVDFAFPAVYSSALMSPVEKLVAVCSGHSPIDRKAGSVRLYDLEQGVEIWKVPGSAGYVDFSGDGRNLLTAGWDPIAKTHRIQLWSIPEQRILRQFDTQTVCHTLALSPNAKWVACADPYSPVIEVWSVDEGRMVWELSGHAGAIRALEFSPDSRLLGSAGIDQIVRLWSVTSGELTAKHAGHTDEITSLAFFPDGLRLASASRDSTVRLWSTSPSHKVAAEFHGGGFVGRLVISPDGQRWASTSQTWMRHQIGSTQTETEFGLDIAKDLTAQVEGFDDGGRTVVTSHFSEERERLWLEWRSLEDQALLRKLVLAGKATLSDLGSRTYSNQGLFAHGQADGVVRVWSTATGNQVCRFFMPDQISHNPKFTGLVDKVAISSDGDLVAAGMLDYSQIVVFSIRENRLLFSRHMRELQRVYDHLIDPGSLAFIGFSPDNTLLASTDSTERRIRFWNARSGLEAGELSGHPGYTTAVAFSPDGKTLASTGVDGSLKLWHLPTHREVATLVDTGAVGALVFSPDGNMLLVGFGREVRIFKTVNPSEMERELRESLP